MGDFQNKKFQIKNTIYHGTISDIKDVDLTIGKGHKDFGKGFYLAYNKSQSIGIINKNYRIENRRGNKNIKRNLYAFDTLQSEFDKCNTKVFYKPDFEWLDFILTCRLSNGTPHKYDVVVGPTADDDTNFCLNMYKEGTYGTVGSFEAKQMLLKNLEVENLGIQVFIGTQQGLKILTNKRTVNF